MSQFVNNPDHKFQFDTLALHVGQEEADPASDSRAVPIYQTTSYVFRNSQHAADRFGLADAGNIYGRLTNSTQGVFEDRIAALEGGVAGLAVASGAAAITLTIQALAQAGDHIVAQKTIYGGSFNFLEHTISQFGVETTFVDAHNLAEVEGAIKENTKAIYLETLGNPNSDIPNIDAISEIAKKHGLPVVVDNTFGTPYLFRPLEHGANIVVHSATKFIGGHGSSLGGVIVDGGNFDWKASGKYAPIAAPNPSYHGVSFADAVGPFVQPLDGGLDLADQAAFAVTDAQGEGAVGFSGGPVSRVGKDFIAVRELFDGGVALLLGFLQHGGEELAEILYILLVHISLPKLAL